MAKFNMLRELYLVLEVGPAIGSRPIVGSGWDHGVRLPFVTLAHKSAFHHALTVLTKAVLGRQSRAHT
jgi:hypothetical protein